MNLAMLETFLGAMIAVAFSWRRQIWWVRSLFAICETKKKVVYSRMAANSLLNWFKWRSECCSVNSVHGKENVFSNSENLKGSKLDSCSLGGPSWT